MHKLLSGLRIVKVSATLNSGAGRAFVFYCHALRELGADVEAWTFAPDQAMLQELADDGFPTRVLGLLKHSHRWSSSRALASELANSAADVVHVHNYETGLHASRAKAAGAINRLIISHHDPRLRWSRRFFAWPHRMTPEMVIAPAPSSAIHIQSWYGYAAGRVVALPMPVNKACFDAPARQEELARELGLMDAYPIIIWVSRLKRHKGQHDLIHAFRAIVEHYPSARLLIVGSGSRGDFLKNLTKRLRLTEQAILTGSRKDVPDLLQVADIFACPSHAETLCMAVQEAMAARKPIVSTAVWGPCDYISDGDNGLLVPIGQPRALADAILRLAADPALAKRLGEAARAYAQENFSMDKFVAGLANIYTRVIDHSQSQA